MRTLLAVAALALGASAQTLFDGTSTETQSWGTVTVSGSTVLATAVEGSNVSLAGRPYGTARIRAYNLLLQPLGPPADVDYNVGKLDVATDPQSGLSMYVYTDYFGAQPDAQAVLYDANGAPAGNVRTLYASNAEMQGVSTGSRLTATAGQRQGWFTVAAEAGDLEIDFHWPDTGGSAGGNFSSEHVVSITNNPPLRSADIREGFDGQTATLLGTRVPSNGSLDELLVSINTANLPGEYQVDNNPPIGNGLPAFGSVAAGGLRIMSWSKWEPATDYVVWSYFWRPDGKPVAPLRYHGYGSQVHADGNRLIWVKSDPIAGTNAVHSWRDAQPWPGMVVQPLPAGNTTVDHVEPFIHASGICAWAEEPSSGPRRVYVGVAP